MPPSHLAIISLLTRTELATTTSCATLESLESAWRRADAQAASAAQAGGLWMTTAAIWASRPAELAWD
jgi:hypothetical protein